MIPGLATLPSAVRIVEVSPRDGLQNEKALIPTAQKIHFINMLAEAGLPVIEATSFVSPRAIPQLSDASAVMSGLERLPTTEFSVLVPNLKGMERALETGVRSIAVFTAASESFTRHNINATIAESLANFRPVVALAQQESIQVRGYISTVLAVLTRAQLRSIKCSQWPRHWLKWGSMRYRLGILLVWLLRTRL